MGAWASCKDGLTVYRPPTRVPKTHDVPIEPVRAARTDGAYAARTETTRTIPQISITRTTQTIQVA